MWEMEHDRVWSTPNWFGGTPQWPKVVSAARALSMTRKPKPIHNGKRWTLTDPTPAYLYAGRVAERVSKLEYQHIRYIDKANSRQHRTVRRLVRRAVERAMQIKRAAQR